MNNLKINQEAIFEKIYKIERNGELQIVMLDKDLADFYQTDTRKINQSVKRNPLKFADQTFKLTKEEWLSILKARNENEEDPIEFKGGHLPSVFTEEGALALSTVLESPVAIQVFKVLLKSFFAMRTLLKERPDLQLHQEVWELKNRVIEVEKKIGENSNQNVVIHQLTNNGTFQLGSNNSMVVKINDFEDVVQFMTELRRHPGIKDNLESKEAIDKSIQLALKADKKGLLEQMSSVISITNNIADLAVKASPVILSILSWLK